MDRKIKISPEMAASVAAFLATVTDGPAMVMEAIVDFLKFSEGEDEDEALNLLQRKCTAALVILRQADAVMSDEHIRQILLGKVVAVAAAKEEAAVQAQPFTEERKASAN